MSKFINHFKMEAQVLVGRVEGLFMKRKVRKIQKRAKYCVDGGDDAEPTFEFLELPKELQILTMCMMDVLGIMHISMTCKDLYLLSRHESVWRSLCQNKWTDIVGSTKEWRKYYYYRTAFLAPEQSSVFQWKVKDVSANEEPPARQSLTGNCVNGKIVYIGGQTSVVSRLNDIYIFDVASRTFSKPVIKGLPPKFARHSAIEIGSKIYVFGGYDGVTSFYGLAVFDIETLTWTNPEVHGDCPIPRTNHAVSVVGKKMYLFGGNDTTSRCNVTKSKPHYGTYGDFYVLDTETMTWEKPIVRGKIPCARSGHHLETVEKKLYLYGGGLWDDLNRAWVEKYDDMFVFNTETKEWKELSPIKPNSPFISVPHWRMGSFLFVYSDQMWAFDTVTNKWSVVKFSGPRPQKRFLGPATFVSQPRTAVYMFGGVYNTILKDLTELTWHPSMTQLLTQESSMNS